jgi:SUMO ligase MMS21 Smc5/6 complex component
MEKHKEKKLEIIGHMIRIMDGSRYQSKSLVEKLLIHDRLVTSPDLLWDKDFYRKAQSWVRTAYPYNNCAEPLESEEIECTVLKKKEICPLTQREIVSRLEGVCGHAVEYEAGMSYLKSNRGNICPHAGCHSVFVERRSPSREQNRSGRFG